MDGGFDSIQILVVVLVVLAQGAGALRAWFRKLKQRREEEYPLRPPDRPDESAYLRRQYGNDMVQTRAGGERRGNFLFGNRDGF